MVGILDSITIMKRASLIMIEEQYINTFGNKFMMNDSSRRLQNNLQGYFMARKKDLDNKDMKIYLVPSKLKIKDCPKEYKKSKPQYKDWTRWFIVDYLRYIGFEDEARVVEMLKKGDDTADAIKQYKEAILEIAKDDRKYLW